MRLHQFEASKGVEARWAPVLDDWFRQMYVIDDATMEQQWRGIDRIVHAEDGPVTLDYKCDTRARDTKRLFMETVSNSETGRPGWLLTSEAEWLVYFVVPDDVWMFRFACLRQQLAAWRQTWPEKPARNDRYSTLGLCVPMFVAQHEAEYIAHLSRGDGAVLVPRDHR